MLNVHSCFSLRYGVVTPENVVDWYLASGYDRIALTDINNTSAQLSYIRLVQQNGRIPVAGIDFRNGINCCYIGIAQNNEGFMELNLFLTSHLHNETDFPERAPELEHCYFIYPWEKAPEDLRRNEYVGIACHQINRFKTRLPDSPDRYVALASMSFLSRQQFNTHRLLRAIDCNTLLSKLPESQQARKDELFVHRQLLEQQFAEFPWLVRNAEALLSRCSIRFEFGEDAPPQNLATYTGSKETDHDRIYELCMENLGQRYGNASEEIRQRIRKELDVIRQKDYLSYFLIAWDIVQYARSKGYFYVGRGSGANSIIAYLMQITDVDPMELDLYFERFINLYRKNPPDFDIDFSWRDRDDVTRYIFERFPNAAMIATYNTFQYRATVRELGKVFGLPKAEIDLLSDEKPNIGQVDEMGKLVLKYSSLIARLPSHLSVHAGGIVISEKPVAWFSPTFLTSKSFPTVQFSMLEAEDAGLYKFDILSQRGLGKIKDCLDIIRKNQPDRPPHDIHDVSCFKNDENINKLLREAKALGCFYIESPGMRMLMTKLKTNSYLELVAASSIIRPGVAQSGMMREYILRHRVPEKRAEAHPDMLRLMPDTYGIMVYQEDVIKVANQFAGLSLEQSDILRRSMSGKYRLRNEFREVRALFFDNCMQKGYPVTLIQAVWEQIESFGGFAFSKGHSASYAVESYQSLYLKTYYPLEYMVATINNFGGFYRTEMYVHEAQKLGGIIEAPCINQSDYPTTINGRTIHLGFQHIMGLEEKGINRILEERRHNGPFVSFPDLTERVAIPMEQLLLLIRIGALRCFNEPKKQLLWKAYLYHNKPVRNTLQHSLFSEGHKTYRIPELEEDPLEQAFEQMELLDFSLCNPFDLVSETIPHHTSATELQNATGTIVTTYGYYVHTKRIDTKSKTPMIFGTFLDINGDQIDTVHFPDSVRQFPFRGRGIYELRGKVTNEFDFSTVEVEYMRKVNYRSDPRYSDDENSHFSPRPDRRQERYGQRYSEA